MRLSKTLMVVPVLALLALGCGPHQHHMGGPPCGHGAHMMMGACGPESCVYKSRCFSSGAVQSNDGVCQACNGGKWVEASGCTDHRHGSCCGHGGCPGGKDCPMMKGGNCPMMKGGKGAPGGHPCMHGGPPCGH